MIATMAPRGHIAKTTVTLRPDGRYVLGVGTSEFGNGTTTVHAQIVATVLATDVDRIELTNSDTDGAEYDTGAFASAGTTVAGKALHARRASRCATSCSPRPRRGRRRTSRVLAATATACWAGGRLLCLRRRDRRRAGRQPSRATRWSRAGERVR